MGEAGDIIALVAALVTAITALITGAVSLTKAKHVENLISMRIDTQNTAQSSAQAGGTHIDGRTFVGDVAGLAAQPPSNKEQDDE